jgi:hypothetical protein
MAEFLNVNHGCRRASSGTGQGGDYQHDGWLMAAQSVSRTQTYLGECNRRIANLLCAAQANKAIAHKLARIVYHLLTTQQEYNEEVFQVHTERFKQRSLKRLQREATYLGFTVAPA